MLHLYKQDKLSIQYLINMSKLHPMKSKIIARLISGKGWKPGEFWDQLPDVVHSTDIEEKAVWRNDKNNPIYIKDKR